LCGDLPLQSLEANLYFTSKQSQEMFRQLSLQYIPHFHFFPLQSLYPEQFKAVSLISFRFAYFALPD